jgi:hypothetical protein
MMKHCQNVKYLTISFDGWTAYGNGIGALVKSLSDLPVLESVKLVRVGLHRREALLLYICLIKKKSVKSIVMVGTGMSEYLASRMLQILKDSDECNQLQFVSFFGHTSSREPWQEQWQEDVDQRSMSDFMNYINSWQTSSNGRNKDHRIITDIVHANKKDSEDGCKYHQKLQKLNSEVVITFFQI